MPSGFVDIAVETDTALDVRGQKVDVAIEVDLALDVTGRRIVPVDIAVETDTAFDVTAIRYKGGYVDLAVETDSALDVTGQGGSTTATREAFQYLELWTKLECEGGIRKGFFLPVRANRRRRVTGDDAFSTGLVKTHRLAAFVAKGAVIREVLSLDGTVVREWPIEGFTKGDGDDLLMAIDCIPVMQKLVNYEITQTDGDGFVYQDVSAIQLTPATILGPSFIRSNTPAWLTTGIVTPTELIEVPFSLDSARSGTRRLEEATDYETALRKNGAAGYLLDHVRLGAAAPTLYLRAGKNVKSLQKEVQPGQITRVTTITGADGDDGPSGIAWAYWLVAAISGTTRVQLAGIHGGAGPIAFDGQFNHINLPGGASSLYLEKMDGTFVQITDSFAATQELVLASVAGIAIGHWVRIVASATGKHLTFLDAPAEIAETGIVAGRFESPWDDTVTVVKNGLQPAWANSAGSPDGWTGLGARTTAVNESLTSGQALLINQFVVDGAQLAAPPVRSWRIATRRAIWSAVAWIRLRSLTTTGHITFQVKANGAVVGSGLIYVGPGNVWRQLKIEGLDLSAFIGTSPSLTVELVKSGGSGVVDMIVDSINLCPALAARAVTEGSNAARIWQAANQFLSDRRAVQVSYRVGAADLARMGSSNQVPIVLGGTVSLTDENDLTTTALRIMEITDHPEDPRETEVFLSTLPARRSRQQSKPLALVIPFLEPVQVRVADRDARNAALLIKAKIVASDAISVTVLLEVKDSLGGTPTIVSEYFGAVYVSGAGIGPYVFLKPTQGSGAGRVVFVASLPGRDDVYDAVDIAESSYVTDPSLLFNECRITVVAISATTYTVAVSAQSNAGTPTVEYVSVTGSASLASGPGIGVPSLSGTLWVFNRGAPASGLGEIRFRAVFEGVPSDDDYLDIAAQGDATEAVVCRPRIVAISATAMAIAVSVVDPTPQGPGSATINYTLSGLLSVMVSPASGQTVTPEATYTEATGTYAVFSVLRPGFGTGDGTVLFRATAPNRLGDSDAVTIPEQALVLVDLVYSECYARVWFIDGSNNAFIDVVATLTPGTATGIPFPGPPVVEYIGVTGGPTFGGGLPAGQQGASGAVWVFALGATPGRVQFRASLDGTVSDDDFVELPAAGDATLRLLSRVRVTNTSPVSVTVRVMIADPTPQGANSATINYENPGGLAIDGASGQTVTPASTLTEAAGTYRDYIISRPASGGVATRVTFIAIAPGRITDNDTVDIPPRQAVIYNMVFATATAITATQYTITVTGVATLGVPSVQLAGISGLISVAAGPAMGVQAASGTKWVINRAPAGSGTGQVQFRGIFPGTNSDDDYVDIVEVGASTTAVSLRARPVSSTATQVLIRVSVADPTPQGLNTGTISYSVTGVGVAVSPASGQLVSPQSTITENPGTFVDFYVTRPLEGDGYGVVKFTGSAAGRVSDSDAVLIPERIGVEAEEELRFGPDDMILLPGAGTAATALGSGTPAGGGSSSQPSLVSTNYALSQRHLLISNGSANATAGLIGFNDDGRLWRGNATGLGGFDYRMRFSLAAAASSRAFFGLMCPATGTNFTLNSFEPDAGQRNHVGVGWKTGVTTFHVIHNDDVSGTTVTDLGVPWVLDQIYEVRISCVSNGNDMTVEIYEVRASGLTLIASVTLSTNIPQNTRFLTYVFDMSSTAAVVHSFRMYFAFASVRDCPL